MTDGRDYAWAKVYCNLPNDPKLEGRTPAEKWLWVCLILLAKGNGDGGVIPRWQSKVPWLAGYAGLRVKDVTVAVAYFADPDIHMLELPDTGENAGCIVLANFADRQQQKPSDSPDAWRERKARSRDMSRQMSRLFRDNVTDVTPNVTPVTPQTRDMSRDVTPNVTQKTEDRRESPPHTHPPIVPPLSPLPQDGDLAGRLAVSSETDQAYRNALELWDGPEEGASTQPTPAPSRATPSTEREAWFGRVRDRHATVANGRSGDLSEAGRAWNEKVPPGEEADVLANLEHYAASDELKRIQPMSLAKFLRVWRQWPEARRDKPAKPASAKEASTVPDWAGRVA